MTLLPEPSPGERYLDAKQLGAILHFEARTIRIMAQKGTIPSLVVRNGSRSYYRFNLKKVLAALATSPDDSGAAG